LCKDEFLKFELIVNMRTMESIVFILIFLIIMKLHKKKFFDWCYQTVSLSNQGAKEISFRYCREGRREFKVYIQRKKV